MLTILNKSTSLSQNSECKYEIKDHLKCIYEIFQLMLKVVQIELNI